jgi:hypothetical protein
MSKQVCVIAFFCMGMMMPINKMLRLLKGTRVNGWMDNGDDDDD